MKIPKYFKHWFSEKGLWDDSWQGMEKWQRAAIMRIAWRAYRQGKQDGRRDGVKLQIRSTRT